MRTIVQAGLILVIVLAAGCAAKPQITPVTPHVDSSALTTRGAGRTMSLDVIDSRGTNVVGYRDPKDLNSVITSSPETVRNIERTVRDAYKALGFQMVEAGSEADIALEVRLTELGYKRDPEGAIKNLSTGATIEVTSIMPTKTVNGKYRDGQGKDTVLRPSLEENAAILNRHLSAAITKMVADARLTEE